MTEPSRSMRENLDALRIEHHDRPARQRGPWLLVLVIVLVIATAAVGWNLWSGRAPRVTVVQALEERTSSRSTVLNASGYVTARRRATVASKVTGQLVEVSVEEGDPVGERQILARIDDSQQRAQLNLAEASLTSSQRAIDETGKRLELARLTLARAERLFSADVIGQADVDAARTDVEALEARTAFERQQIAVAERTLALRQVDLEDTLIRAPFDGVVVSKDAQQGEMVSPISAGGGFTRTGIYSLVDMTSLEIEVDVNEAYISRVQADQPVEAILDAYPDWRIPAHVITTIPTADRQKATVQVRIGFDALDERILPDMGVKVSFQDGSDPATDVDAPRARVTVPHKAVRGSGEQGVVFVVVQDRVERRAVRLGAAADGRIEIVAGLAGGERVVVDVLSGSTDLQDGVQVVVE